MDALTLLREVSEAYRRLQSLAVDSNQRNEQRVRFFYAAPDRIRFESGGRHGMVQVSDGSQLHTLFGGHPGDRRPQYTSIPAAQMHRLPHLFRPDFPFGVGDEAFLFQGIEARVAAAEVVRAEDGCHVVSVTYEPSPHAHVIITGPAVLFRANAESRMIMGQEGEIGHRFPTEEEVTWTRHTTTVQSMRVNEQLPEDTFRFVPPADARKRPDDAASR